MKIVFPALIAVAAVVVLTSRVSAETMDGHMIIAPQEIKWAPAPAVLPPGAEAAVLYGDPTKEGLFALRLKLPKGYSIPPHTHPVDEVVTVISGIFTLGMGETVDQSKTQTLPAGSFFTVSPDTAHFASVDEETVVQISTVGPWGLNYVNPKDDPRPKSQ